MTQFESRFLPAAVLGLLAALVLVSGLWVTDLAKRGDEVAEGVNHSQSKRVREWKLVTTWPKNFPGLGKGAETFANMVNTMSGGRLHIRVYGAGEIVPAFEVFDAVSQGTAQVGHGASYYWKGKLPGAVFFTAVPFGLTSQEMNAWIHYGGGLELWQELYAPFDLVPMAGGSTGVQMAGWFNREVRSVEDLKGLKMRIPGLAGEVFDRAGGTPVRLPGSEIYTSLQTGVVDAAEWVGPYNDLTLGLHQVAQYYYYPGWQEPGPMLEIIVNAPALEALPADLQAIVRVAARAANQDMLDDFTANNNRALKELVDTHGVKLRRLPDDVFLELYKASELVTAELIAKDPMAAKIYRSFKAFYDDVYPYHAISEQAYINTRDMVLKAH